MNSFLIVPPSRRDQSHGESQVFAVRRKLQEKATMIDDASSGSADYEPFGVPKSTISGRSARGGLSPRFDRSPALRSADQRTLELAYRHSSFNVPSALRARHSRVPCCGHSAFGGRTTVTLPVSTGSIGIEIPP